jgi:hypothetical protein
MQKIDDCKEIRLALTRAGIATRPEKCLQTFRLVVTAQYIYHSQQPCRQDVFIRGRVPFSCRAELICCQTSEENFRHNLERRQMRAVQRTGGAALVSHQEPKP